MKMGKTSLPKDRGTVRTNCPLEESIDDDIILRPVLTKKIIYW